MAEKRSSSAAAMPKKKRMKMFSLMALLENELKTSSSSLAGAAAEIILDDFALPNRTLAANYISSDPKLAALMDDLDDFLSGEFQDKLYAKCEAIGKALEEKLQKDKTLN